MSFYVKCSREARPEYGTFDPPKKGWTGPLRTESRAEREAQAWRDSGWEAEVLLSTPEVRAEVRAWTKAAK